MQRERRRDRGRGEGEAGKGPTSGAALGCCLLLPLLPFLLLLLLLRVPRSLPSGKASSCDRDCIVCVRSLQGARPEIHT